MYSELGVLVCDDNPDDCFFLTRAFMRAGIDAQFSTVHGGEEAIEYLLGQCVHVGGRLPMLMLLDLKMPKVDGFGVLEWMRKHPSVRVVPVVVLSSSELPQDIDRAYELGCNAYIVKPHGSEEMDELYKGLPCSG